MKKKALLSALSGIIIVFILSILSFHPNDCPWFVSKVNYPPLNLLGSFGMVLSSGVFLVFGAAAYLFGLVLIALFSRLVPFFPFKLHPNQIFGITLLFLSASIGFGVIHDPFVKVLSIFYEGGLFGNFVAGILRAIVGMVGTYALILLLAGYSVTRILMIPFQPYVWGTWVYTKTVAIINDIRRSVSIKQMQPDESAPFIQRVTLDPEPEGDDPQNQPSDTNPIPNSSTETKSHGQKPGGYPSQSQPVFEQDPTEMPIQVESYYVLPPNHRPITTSYKQISDSIKITPISIHTTPMIRDIGDTTHSIDDDPFHRWLRVDIKPTQPTFEPSPPQEDPFFEQEVLLVHETTNAPMMKEPSNTFGDNPAKNLSREDIVASLYESTNKEGFASLERNKAVPDTSFREESREIINKLEKTFQEFKLEARVIHISRGPVITRYEIEPAPGIKLSKIVSLADNLTLALAVSRIRVIAPIPGKSAVGIEVPNKKREKVTLGDIFDHAQFNPTDQELPIVLGKDLSGQVIVKDLVSMPHLLIAGSTGSGKSVCINTIICSLLYSLTPDQVRFILVDPKIVELKMYNDIPYLLTPVITEPKKATSALKWAVTEMENRYRLLDRYNSRDIRSFNKKMDQLAKQGIIADSKLEYIVIIIDELADLMMICGKDVEEQIARLSAMSRAVGIHLILATQRPSVDIITGIIKANCPARISFQVSSRIESRIILDTIGADKLLGKGDMLLSMAGLSEPIRIQGALLTEDEVHHITTYLKKQGSPDYVEDMFENDDLDDSSDFNPDEEPMWKEACAIVIGDGKASASYLQRRLKIGYNRAARIVEHMEAQGIVGPSLGSKPREVLVSDY